MRSALDPFVARAAAHGRAASRRGFLTDAAKLAGGGALAVALVGGPGGGVRSALAKANFEDDLSVLQYALTLEHLEYAFYRDGLRMFSAADFEESYPASVYPNLETIRNHEGTHVEQLTKVIADLGGEPVEEAAYDFGYGDIAGFLEVAALLENTGVAAYAGAAPFIKDEGILAAALGIHSVEARHAAYLNARIGESPFPVPNDEPLAAEKVLAAAGKFIVE